MLFRGCPSESQHAARQSAPQSECSNWQDALVPVPENRNHNQDDRDNPQKHILCRIFFGCHGRSKPHPQFVSSPSFWPDFVTISAPAQTSRPARGSRCQAFRRTRRRPTQSRQIEASSTIVQELARALVFQALNRAFAAQVWYRGCIHSLTKPHPGRGPHSSRFGLLP